MKNLTLLVYCKLRAFLADEEGANAIEYAVIAGRLQELSATRSLN